MRLPLLILHILLAGPNRAFAVTSSAVVVGATACLRFGDTQTRSM